MDNEGLLFIPDISGYTRFINETEIEHSRFIIQELLEVLVNSNHLNLTISEIEGDAILFYRFGKPPEIAEMYEQVETMFCNFHKQLKRYEQRRICPCAACTSAKNLSLKIITHHGEFSTYSVKEFSKLIGKDVIKAHQLLKNDIPLHEYWLVTDNLYKPGPKHERLPEWFEWKSGSKKDEANEITFYYSLLTPLKEGLPEEEPGQWAIKGDRLKMLTVQKDFDKNIDELFNVVGDLTQRPKWVDGIIGVEKISTTLPEVGTVHNCVMPKGANTLVTSYFSRDDNSIVLEETDKRKIGTCQMLLEKTGEDKTSMTFNFFIKKNLVLPTVFNLFMKKKILGALARSLDKLDIYLNNKNSSQ